MIARLFRLVPPEFSPLVPRLFAAIAANALCQAAAYALLVPTLDALFDGNVGRAWWWTLAIAVAVAAMWLFGYLQATIGLRISVGMQHSVQTRLGDHLNSLPLGWFTTHPAARISRTVVDDVREIQGAVAYLTAKIVTSVVVPVAVAIAVVFVDWRVGLTMLVAAPILFTIDRVASWLYRRADTGAHEAAVEADARVVEFAQAQPVLRAFGATGEGTSALDRALRRQKSATLRTVAASVPGLVVFALAVQAAFLVFTFVVVGRVTGGEITVSAAVALIAVSARFVEPLTQAAQLAGAIRTAGDAVDRVTALLAEAGLPEPDAPAVDTSGPTGVEFDDVTFGYDPASPVLRNVTFATPPGTTTAIVGPSGAGKSTLLTLVARFHDVDTGAVRVGGVDVRDQSTATLLGRLGLVFQNVYLFDRSIEENIRVGRPGAADADVRRAAAAARVDEIAERSPDGWATRVGEGGSSLSGGERQRVSIARAVLEDAPVVLLDEVTSALDPQSEAAVVRGLRELTRDKAVLVVAHRLSTIAHADQILFLDSGRIVELGTHAELLAADGRYAGFWNERTRSSGWRLNATSSTPAP